MPRLPQSITLVALLATGLFAVAACGSDADATPAELAQQRAQAGLLQSYTATYALQTSSKTGTAKPAGTMTVARTPNRLRLDITTAAGVSSSITTPEGTVACQKPASGRTPTCLTVAAAGKTPPAAFDPVLRKAFGDVLRTFAADPDGITVEGDADDTQSAAGLDCRWFEVTAATEGKVPAGTYCLSEDGIPVALEFPSGDALLTTIDRTAPADTAFAPAVAPSPLPTTTS